MTKTKKQDKAKKIPELTLEVQVGDQEQVRPWNAGLWKVLGEVVSFVPSYRNTRQGRSTRKQVRIMLLVIGIVLMAFGGQAESAPALWILCGVAIASSIFIIPVEDLKKRGWRTTIKKKQRRQTRRKWRPGAVAISGGRLELALEGKRVRRIRLDRGKHDLVARRRGDWTCLGVLPPGAKKEDNIWVCTDGAVDAVMTDGSGAEEPMDLPARVSATDWERLWDVLAQID